MCKLACVSAQLQEKLKSILMLGFVIPALSWFSDWHIVHKGFLVNTECNCTSFQPKEPVFDPLTKCLSDQVYQTTLLSFAGDCSLFPDVLEHFLVSWSLWIYRWVHNSTTERSSLCPSPLFTFPLSLLLITLLMLPLKSVGSFIV